MQEYELQTECRKMAEFLISFYNQNLKDVIFKKTFLVARQWYYNTGYNPGN